MKSLWRTRATTGRAHRFRQEHSLYTICGLVRRTNRRLDAAWPLSHRSDPRCKRCQKTH